MRSRVALWVAVPVLVVLLGFIVVLATSGQSGTSGDTSSRLIGRPAPPLAGETLAGEQYALSAQEGEFVLVNFFATWCVPCVREHPELVEFAERHAETGDASVVSVVYDAKVSTVRDFFAEQGGDWPVVTDPDGRIALEYGVSGVPESYLVAPDGTVVSKLVGGVTASGLDEVLRQARGGAR